MINIKSICKPDQANSRFYALRKLVDMFWGEAVLIEQRKKIVLIKLSLKNRTKKERKKEYGKRETRKG